MSDEKPLAPQVFWFIWFALMLGIVIYPFVLGGGIPQGKNATTATMSPVVFVCVAQILAASLMRWVFIPKARTTSNLLIWMILGLSLSEAVVFYSLFLVPANQPETKLTLWILSFLGAFQFIPTFVKRLASPEERRFLRDER